MVKSRSEPAAVAAPANRSEKAIRCFLADESGQAATEYVLVVGLFVVFIVVAYNTIQESLRDLLVRIVGFFNGPGI